MGIFSHLFLFFNFFYVFLHCIKQKLLLMGRKKKIVEEVVLKPSHYQEAIYDFVEHDVGNLVVEAAAGAGKTSTLLQILRLLPSDKKVLFCAFNKDIVKEITKKVPKDITNVDIAKILIEKINLKNFPQLHYLDCSYNSIDELDLSPCPQLLILDCEKNKITTLDTTQNLQLETIIK